MPSRPRPRPTPTTFDVFKPGKGKPSPTSRPVIVSDKPQVQDSTLVEKHGAPVPNARHGTHPILASLTPRQVAPSAHAVHHPYPIPHVESTDEHTESDSKISHAGHMIARPSGDMASRHAALMHHKVTPAKIRIKPPESKPEPEEKEEPNLAVPITPIEQPAGLANAKTEGKAELLAAMPVEIRRSVANAEGMTAADWEAPSVEEVPAAPVAKKAPAPVTKISINDGSEPQTATQEVPTEVTAPASSLQPATAGAGAESTQAIDEVPMLDIKTKKNRSSDTIVFIIMMVLFLGLGTVVAMLFITGTISI